MKGSGLQNKSWGSIDRKDGDSGLSTLTNIELVGNDRDNGSKGNSGVGKGADGGEINSGESTHPRIFPILAFKARICGSDNGPSTWESDVKSREQDGIGSTPPPMLALASIKEPPSGSDSTSLSMLTSVNAKFSMQLTGAAALDPSPTSTTWQEGNKRVTDRQISSFADKLTFTDEAAIFDTLKENKKENKVLCSNST